MASFSKDAVSQRLRQSLERACTDARPYACVAPSLPSAAEERVLTMDAPRAATSSHLFARAGVPSTARPGQPTVSNSGATAHLSSPLLLDRTSFLRILLVDSQREVAEKLKHQLLSSQQKDCDHQVKCCQHGLEAMVVAEGFQPQLVVIEVGWPRRSGACTAKLLRDRPWSRTLVIVSHSRHEDRSFEPTEHFDFHFFDGLDVVLLMQMYDNLAKRRTAIGRDLAVGQLGTSKIRLHAPGSPMVHGPTGSAK